MPRASIQRILVILVLAGFGIANALADDSAADLPGVHDFLHAATNVYSGSQPEGDAAFAALAELGVRTLISVDGAKPDVELAGRHGLRYIHLPFGYDGIPARRVAELARAATTAEGPIYVHCHHGKHRGPSAVGVICLASGSMTVPQAEAFLHSAGTSPDYPGLFRAITDFVAPTAAELAAVPTNFPSGVSVSSLVDAMVSIDAHFDHLKAVQRAGWRTPTEHPDISPAHEAVLLWEQLRELARTGDTAGRSADYRARLGDAESAAGALHPLLRTPQPEAAAADAALNRIGQSCVGCHQDHRNTL